MTSRVFVCRSVYFCCVKAIPWNSILKRCANIKKEKKLLCWWVCLYHRVEILAKGLGEVNLLSVCFHKLGLCLRQSEGIHMFLRFLRYSSVHDGRRPLAVFLFRNFRSLSVCHRLLICISNNNIVCKVACIQPWQVNYDNKLLLAFLNMCTLALRFTSPGTLI